MLDKNVEEIDMTKKTIIAFFIILVATTGCGKGHSSFSILMQELPQRIDPYDSPINYKLYVLKQLFEPLFMYSSSGNYSSNLLSSWQASRGHTFYELCIKDGLKYSNGKNFTVKELKLNLLRLQSKGMINVPIRNMSENNMCLIIEFEHPYKRFPSDMSSYSTSMVDPETENNDIKVGISDYRVESITPDRIHLHTSNKRLTYSDILFYKWREKQKDTQYNVEDIDDFNQLPVEYLPDIILSFNKYEAPILVTLIALINSKNQHVREILYNCLNFDELRRIFTPKRSSFRDIGGLLPLGVLGATETPPVQHCDFLPLKKPVTLNYFEALRPNSVEDLQRYMDKQLTKYNIKVNVINIEINELANALLSKDKPFDFTVIGMDAPTPDPYSFFQYFFDKRVMITNIDNPKIRELMDIYLSTDNIEEKRTLVEMANQALLDNFQIIPLYQDERIFYFPKRIKNITSDPIFLNFMKISEL
jgi:MarR-like DNA-binding transcriptional regulator SgrR of sgrS sRNA